MMEEVCGGETPYMSTAELNDEHEKCKVRILLFLKIFNFNFSE